MRKDKISGGWTAGRWALQAGLLAIALAGLWWFGQQRELTPLPGCERFTETIGLQSSDYVLTPWKLGLDPAAWSVRENVIFNEDHFDDVHYQGTRGFEFYWEGTPGDASDPYQQVHTTINLYDSAAYAGQLSMRGEAIYLHTQDLRIYLDAADGLDREHTTGMRFVVGRFLVVLKTKYVDDLAARQLLTRGAGLVIDELRSTCEGR